MRKSELTREKQRLLWEVINNKQNGILLSGISVEEIKESIDQYDPQINQVLSDNAVKTILHGFSFEAVVEKEKMIFEYILSQ